MLSRPLKSIETESGADLDYLARLSAIEDHSLLINSLRISIESLESRQTPLPHIIPKQTDRTERMNQEIEQYLRLFINYRQNDWKEWLSCAEFSYNDKIQSSTGHSPFYVTMDVTLIKERTYGRK